VLHTNLYPAVITHLVLSLARMLLAASSAQENVKSMKEIGNVAMDVHLSVKVLLARGELWKNAENTTWSLRNVSMKSAL